jgi:hypothetical protein
MLRRMTDDFMAEPEDIQALIDELDVQAIDSDPDWNVQFWLPEYAEPILGETIFESLEQRIRAIPGVERLAWEDREVFLAKVAPGTSPETLHERLTEIVRDAAAEAGHRLP